MCVRWMSMLMCDADTGIRDSEVQLSLKAGIIPESRALISIGQISLPLKLLKCTCVSLKDA